MSVSKPLSYSHTPQTYTDTHSTVPVKLEEHARKQPDKVAFVIYGLDGKRLSITCSQLYNKSVALARGLKKLGVVKGDIICISLPNSLEWTIAAFGSMIAGAALLCLEMYEIDGSDVKTSIQKAGKCKAVISNVGDGDEKRRVFQSIISDEATPKPEFIIYTDAEGLTGCEIGFNSVLDNQSGEPQNVDLPVITHDDIALIVPTSGSTGTPKLVQLSQKFLLVKGYNYCKMMRLSCDDILYIPHSFGWGAGFCVSFIFVGCTRITCHRKLLTIQKDLVHFTKQLLQQERCTTAVMTPQLILNMLDTYENIDFKRLRLILATGVPAPVKCSDVLGRFSDTFVNGYGSSEPSMISYISVSNSVEFESFLVGRPVDGAEIKIVDVEGDTVIVGDTGEIYVRKRVVFNGYLNDSEKTKRSFTDDGWYKTEDMGYMKDNGSLVIIGRKSEIFKYATVFKNVFVSPYYVESMVRDAVDGIDDVCVVGVLNPNQIRKMCICVILKEDAAISANEIKSILRHRKIKSSDLHEYQVIIFDKFPKLNSGKIARKQVEKEAADMLFQ